MILYFSAAGNSRHVAQRLAEVVHTSAISIESVLKENADAEISLTCNADEAFGLVVPTYFWGLPRMVERLLQRLSVEGDGYRFFVTTYGTTTGQIGTFAHRIARKRGWAFDAFFSVRMPDVWTPMFDLSNKKKVSRRLEKAERELDTVAKVVRARQTGNHMHHRVPMLLSRLYHWYGFHHYTTAHFSVDAEACIACGLCAKQCPAQSIEMCDGLPQWTQPHCELCLGCLHRCPKFAIQYGKNTRKHGQYLYAKQ